MPRSFSADPIEERHAFALSPTDTGDDNLRQWSLQCTFTLEGATRAIQLAMNQTEDSKRNIDWKLRFDAVPEISACGSNWKARMTGKERALLGGRGLRAGGTGNQRNLPGTKAWGEPVPHLRERRLS